MEGRKAASLEGRWQRGRRRQRGRLRSRSRIGRLRLDRRIDDQAVSRTVNGQRKMKEDIRRDARMKGIIKSAKAPYTQAIWCYISEKLDKPSTKITEAEIKALVESK
jgi:hypothetical protein